MQGVEDEKETVYCLTMILRFNHEWIPHLTFVTRFPRLTPRSSKMNDLRTTMTPKSSAASLSVFGSLQEATAKNSRIQLVPLEQTNEAHERHDSATLHDFSLFASWSFTSNLCQDGWGPSASRGCGRSAQVWKHWLQIYISTDSTDTKDFPVYLCYLGCEL